MLSIKNNATNQNTNNLAYFSHMVHIDQHTSIGTFSAAITALCFQSPLFIDAVLKRTIIRFI